MGSKVQGQLLTKPLQEQTKGGVVLLAGGDICLVAASHGES